MKKLFKVLVAYLIGVVLVFSLVWRVNSLENNSDKLATNYNHSSYAYN